MGQNMSKASILNLFDSFWFSLVNGGDVYIHGQAAISVWKGGTGVWHSLTMLVRDTIDKLLRMSSAILQTFGVSTSTISWSTLCQGKWFPVLDHVASTWTFELTGTDCLLRFSEWEGATTSAPWPWEGWWVMIYFTYFTSKFLHIRLP